MPDRSHYDLVAESDIVKRYSDQLEYLLRRQNLKFDEVQDLCQDTFVVVIQKLRNDDIQKTDAMGAFIRSVGMNLMIEYKRKQTRRKTDPTENFDHLFESSTCVESQISHKQFLNVVVEVILLFDIEREREILRLTYLELKNKDYVREKLSLSAEHYDRVIYRARGHLKDALLKGYGIDLKEHSLNDYLLSLFIFMIFQTNFSDSEKTLLALGGSQITPHYLIESAYLVADSASLERVNHDT